MRTFFLIFSLTTLLTLTACTSTPPTPTTTPDPKAVMSATPIVYQFPKPVSFSYQTKAGLKGTLHLTIESLTRLPKTEKQTEAGKDFYLANLLVKGEKNNNSINPTDKSFGQFQYYLFQEGQKGYSNLKKDQFSLPNNDRKNLSDILITTIINEKTFVVFPVLENSRPSILAFTYIDKDRAKPVVNSYFSLLDGKQWQEDIKPQ